MIRTIDEFMQASEEEIRLVRKDFDPLADLQAYLSWLNSPNGHRLESTFRVGYSGRERQRGLHASAMAKPGRCALAHYKDIMEEAEATQTVRTEMQLIFDHGTVLHSLFQTYFLDMYEHEDEKGNDFTPELTLKYPPLKYSSTHGDGKFDRGWYRVLLELKSAKEGGTQGIEKAIHRPFPGNVRQIMQYMKFADIPFGYLLYYCKNNGKMYGHLIRWDQAMWDEIEAEATPIVQAAERGEPPETKVGHHCSDCQWRMQCREGKEFLSGRQTEKRRLALARSKARRS